MSRFAGHRQVVGSGAAGLVGAAGQAAMARPVMSAQISTAWAVVPALTKALNICGYWLTETVYNPETFASAKYYVYDRIKGGHFRPRIAKHDSLRNGFRKFF